VTEPSALNRPSRRDAQLAPWRAFLRAHARVERRLDEDLRTRHGLSLQEYETLLHLAESPERGLRMGRLADSLLLSKSGVTRLVDRLVEDGLVARTSCASDARGAEATLTALGLARLRAAAPTHLDGIRRYFFAAIEADDLAVVERAMDAISEGLCIGAAHCDPALHDETEPKAAPRRHGHAAAPDGAGDRLPAGISPGH
jgi:DNA-binding MarR family transcriptional regulator